MTDTSDLDRQIEQLKKCEIIREAEVKALCAKAREILVEESNVQRVDSPVTVSLLCEIINVAVDSLWSYFRCAVTSMDSSMT